MRTLGICGGNGVILYPFRRHLMGNIEIRALFHTPEEKQWKANFGDIPYFRKFKDYLYDKNFMGIKPDIIIGAPDCGHSSILSYSRKKAMSDPFTNDSLMLFLNGINILKPKFFLMENLPKVVDSLTPDKLSELIPNYEFTYISGPVSMFGNSQFSRIRLIIIGYNKDNERELNIKAQYHFNSVYKVNDIVNCETLLKGLGFEDLIFGHVRENINSIITMYAGFKISLKEAQKIWLNGNETRWNVKGKKFTTAPGVYRNLDKKAPMVARKANRQFNQVGLQMTPRELARIQGVPDRFKIYMESENIGYWINKGRTTVTKTPPMEIPKWFYKQVKNLEL